MGTMSVLDRVNDPRDLRGLPKDDLLRLCEEIRAYTVDMVQRTGGHISSSLGTVELTVALHRVFESPRDKLVWDTGHQAYIHKMLTGRRPRFETLRQFGGISGFLARTESEHDQFGAGHAGTSISAAHGMAIARDLKREDWSVVAIIGDGALTAGMAFEGLNNIGHDKRRVIVVLNDNGMSIAPNVGAVSRMLETLRTAQPYRGAKHVVRQMLDHMPAGDLAEEARRRIFNSLKALLIPNLLFEQLGFTYFGPVDGHDLFAVESVLTKARDFRDGPRSEEHTSELQSPCNLVCRPLLEKKHNLRGPRRDHARVREDPDARTRALCASQWTQLAHGAPRQHRPPRHRHRAEERRPQVTGLQ